MLDAIPSPWDTLLAQQAESLSSIISALPPHVVPALLAAQAVVEAAQAQVTASQAAFAALESKESKPHSTIGGSVDYQFRIDEILAETTALQQVLQVACPADSVAINASLDTAFGKLYELAQFISGDYDARLVEDGFDNDKRLTLLNEVLAAFKLVVQGSEDAFARFSSIHEKSVEIRSAKLVPFMQELDITSKQLDVKLEGLQRTIQDANSNLDRLQRSMNDAQNNMNTLHERKESAEQAGLAADIGFGILTLGIWSIVQAADDSKGPSAVLGIQDDINKLQCTITDIYWQQQRFRNEVATYQVQIAETVSNLEEQKVMKMRLPGFEARINSNIEALDGMIKTIIMTKDIAAAMVVRMGTLCNDAIAAAHESLVKKEYASAILDICLDGAIDKPRVQAISMIRNEIESNYAVKVPTSVVQKLQTLAQKCKEITESS